MSSNLYVGNLNYDTTEDTLRALFAACGEVESVRVITDRYTGRSRGFAFVEMATEEGAEKAISEVNGKSVDGRQLRVDKAKPRSDRGPRGGDRGYSRW
ncbi:MAG: RNA-binding protein [Anaerolineae bacterium]|jgi:RNA recognition motif-containing protein